MNDEIKEIFNKHGKCHYDDEYCLKYETYIIDLQELKILYDYIINLQEKVDQYENPDDLTLITMYCDLKAKDKIKQLQEENEILKESNVCVGCNNNPDYKSKIDKAIEYIKDDWYELNTRDIEHCINLNKDIRIDLLNILQGSDKDEFQKNVNK